MSGNLDCATVQEALSARLDGHGQGRSAALQAHLAGCGGCRAYAAGAEDLRRRAQMRPVEATAAVDLTERVTSAVTNPFGLPGAGPWPLERVLLLVLGLAQLVLAIPPLLGADLAASTHVAREVGVTDLALAVGLLAAGWQPWRAAGMLPVIATLAGGLATVAVVDILAGRVSVLDEARHLLAPVGALLLYLVRRRTPSPGPAVSVGHSPDLTVVNDEDGPRSA